jgi:hypothetical protein
MGIGHTRDTTTIRSTTTGSLAYEAAVPLLGAASPSCGVSFPLVRVPQIAPYRLSGPFVCAKLRAGR